MLTEDVSHRGSSTDNIEQFTWASSDLRYTGADLKLSTNLARILKTGNSDRISKLRVLTPDMSGETAVTYGDADEEYEGLSGEIITEVSTREDPHEKKEDASRRDTQNERPTILESGRRNTVPSLPHEPLPKPTRHSTFPASLEHVQSGDENTVSEELRRMRSSIVAKRENKRKKRAFLEDERVLVGNKVSEGHSNYVVAYNMLTGIRVAVSRCSGIMEPLTEADFGLTKKLAFDVTGSELTPSSRYDFKFKDYAPNVFRELRKTFGLDPADYLMSLTSKYILSELGSPGKSGSFFYFSRDYRFIIKTIHHSEHRLLRRVLKDYYSYVKDNPDTLISQFYGLHRVKMPWNKVKGLHKVHFIVMNNLFPPHRDIHAQFDLKGSLMGRYTEAEKAKDEKKQVIVLKDQNWLVGDYKIKLGPAKRVPFLTQLEKDVNLLQRLNIMDYSLLVGFHYMREGNLDNPVRRRQPVVQSNAQEELTKTRQYVDMPTHAVRGRFYHDDCGLRGSDENDNDIAEFYYMGVIDCLTPYTNVKRLETAWRSIRHKRSTVSAVPPSEYGDRFLSFVRKAVTGSGEDYTDEDYRNCKKQI